MATTETTDDTVYMETLFGDKIAAEVQVDGTVTLVAYEGPTMRNVTVTLTVGEMRVLGELLFVKAIEKITQLRGR